MKKIAASMFLITILLVFSSCDDDENSSASCPDDSLKRSTNIILGDVLERCVDGKWYAVRECGDANDCPEMNDDYITENN